MSPSRGENTKYLKPPPSIYVSVVSDWIEINNDKLRDPKSMSFQYIVIW